MIYDILPGLCLAGIVMEYKELRKALITRNNYKIIRCLCFLAVLFYGVICSGMTIFKFENYINNLVIFEKYKLLMQDFCLFLAFVGGTTIFFEDYFGVKNSYLSKRDITKFWLSFLMYIIGAVWVVYHL